MIWAALNIEILKPDEGEARGVWGSGEKREITEKTHQAAALSGTIASCENLRWNRLFDNEMFLGSSSPCLEPDPIIPLEVDCQVAHVYAVTRARTYAVDKRFHPLMEKGAGERLRRGDFKGVAVEGGKVRSRNEKQRAWQPPRHKNADIYTATLPRPPGPRNPIPPSSTINQPLPGNTEGGVRPRGFRPPRALEHIQVRRGQCAGRQRIFAVRYGASGFTPPSCCRYLWVVNGPDLISWETKHGYRWKSYLSRDLQAHALKKMASLPNPPHEGEPGSSSGRNPRDFRCGNHAGRCRWSAGFLGDIQFPSPYIPALLHAHVTSPQSALNTSILTAVQISPDHPKLNCCSRHVLGQLAAGCRAAAGNALTPNKRAGDCR
ncbi:hypothetical protein PR048_032729 [Dryococelus australis]|uniref:Uncharacterized protein n=1 Tax=Dryococelus australis TaxID=614101 RepID=A0ABQ9G462_9NEOP|nr:hypothetical protein PR048_032729 [Dryococelus australis]